MCICCSVCRVFFGRIYILPYVPVLYAWNESSSIAPHVFVYIRLDCDGKSTRLFRAVALAVSVYNFIVWCLCYVYIVLGAFYCNVMNTWISAYNIQMANNLMKWWRTKFLNGYKQFSGKSRDFNGIPSRSYISVYKVVKCTLCIGR